MGIGKLLSDLGILGNISTVLQVAALISAILGGASVFGKHFVDKRISDIKARQAQKTITDLQEKLEERDKEYKAKWKDVDLRMEGIDRQLAEVVGKKRQELVRNFPAGFSVFGVLKSGAWQPGPSTTGVDVDWTTGRVVSSDDKQLLLMLPNMKIKTPEGGSFIITECVAGLRRQVGIVQNLGYKFGPFLIQGQLLQTNPDVIAIGFKSTSG